MDLAQGNGLFECQPTRIEVNVFGTSMTFNVAATTPTQGNINPYKTMCVSYKDSERTAL
jgi:hypothetical protein